MRGRLIISVILLLIVMSMLCAYSSAAPMNYVSPAVQRQVKENCSSNVIVVIDKQPAATLARGNARITAQAESSSFMNVKSDLGIINGYAGTMTKQGLDALASSGLHYSVYEDRVLHVMPSAPLNLPRITGSLNLSDQIIGANYSWDVLNITGANITVAEIDTGIYYNDTDFGGCYGNNTANTTCRVIGGYNYINSSADPLDDNGHGTHVAGIIGANGIIRGVAPDVRFYALKACDSTGSCTESNILSALQWAQNHSADIITMSIGGSASDLQEGNSGLDLLSLAVDSLVSDNITVVIAAGNDGPGISTIDFPGSASGAITVGAIDDNGTITTADDSVASFSSRGPAAFGRLDPDIVSPGVNINSTWTNNTYQVESGTSMATPFVTGTVALMLSQVKSENKSLAPSQVRAVLLGSAQNSSGSVFDTGVGLVDVQAALTSGLYAQVYAQNTNGTYSLNDRWEFVVTPYSSDQANITIINNNNYNITFNSSITSLLGMEDSASLNTSQLYLPASINVSNDSNYTFSVNFTLTNFSNTYATTYGGMILLSGTMDNGTANITKTLRIPVVITVPMYNYFYGERTMLNAPVCNTYPDPMSCEDVFSYAYYNSNPRNDSFAINWTGNTNELDLYLYDHSWNNLAISNNSGITSQRLLTTGSDSIKWIRIDGYSFTGIMPFDINITENANSAPQVLNITDGSYSNNGTSAQGGVTTYYLRYMLGSNITIHMNFTDPDNDLVSFSINDSRFSVQNQTNDSAIIFLAYNSSLPNNISLFTKLSDTYGASASVIASIVLYNDITLLSHSPSSPVYLNATVEENFSVAASDVNNATLYYYWSVNSSLNSTAQNFTFNALDYNQTHYFVSLLISDNSSSNSTNQTLFWDVYIDREPPTISIVSPQRLLNFSRVDINFTSSDAVSGTSSCWYFINDTAANTTVLNFTDMQCANISVYLANGNYILGIYSNDSVGNIGYNSTVFTLDDTTPPMISNASPQSQTFAAGTTNVTLSLMTDKNATCRYAATDENYSAMPGMFIDNITLHTVSYAVSSGNFNIYIRCTDMSNNTDNKSTAISFTVSAPAQSSGGSGGGGGGSGGGGGPANIISSSQTESYITDIVLGENNLSFSSVSIPVSFMTIESSAPASSVHITLFVPNVPEHYYLNSYASIYSYFEINHTGLDEVSISHAMIYFTVPRSWLTNMSLNSSSISLIRYDNTNNSWSILSARLINYDSSNFYYMTQSPGLSLYAIASINMPSQTQETGPTNLTNATPTGMQNQAQDANASRLEKNNTLHVVSQQGTQEGSNMSVFAATRPEKLQLALALLVGVFLLVVFIGIAVRSSSRSYEEEILRDTSKEFKNAGREIEEKEDNRKRKRMMKNNIKEKSSEGKTK